MPKAKSPKHRLHEARGLRLKIAVRYHYRHAREFGEALERDGVVTLVAFYSHLKGDKWPSDKPEIVREYERRLGVPAHWISDGQGETLDVLEQALAVAEAKTSSASALAATTAALLQLLPFFPPRRTEGPGVNQQSQEIATESSIISQIRHIPILQDSQIGRYLSGERASDMLEDTIAIPADLGAGPRAFGWRVRAHDLSMQRANGTGFLPGTRLLVDPDAPISPGCYVLAKPKSRPSYMLRRYQAAFDHDGAQPFTLEAINPSFEAIRVTDPASWEIAGRVILVLMAPEAI
jgi:hypothetical protein